MSKFKKATKRITAVAASAALVSSAVFGASLGNYPNNFVSNEKFNGQVVFGASADAMDSASAASIIDDLKDEFSGNNEKVMITYKSSSSGGEKLSATRSNAALNYGETIEAVTETSGFDDQDADVLEDGRFNNGISDEDYTQSVKLKNGTFNFALKDEVDGVNEITDGIFYNNAEEFAVYTLDFDSSIDLSSTDFDEELIGEELIIMGNEFTVAEVSADGSDNLDSITLVGGANKISIGEGESTSVTIDGTSYEIAVQAVSDGATTDKVLLTVNGKSKSVDEFDTEDIAGVTIAVTDLVPSSRDTVKGYAELVVGGQKIKLEEGDVQINDEDVDDLYDDYEIDVEFNGNGMDQIVIRYQVSDDVLLQAGDSLDDVLFDAFSLVYEGTNEPEWHVLDVRVSDDDIRISGKTEGGEDFNRDFLHMEDDTNSSSGVWIRGDQEEDRIFFDASKDFSANLNGPTLASNTNASFNVNSTSIKGSGFLLEVDNEEQYLYEISDIKTGTTDHDTDFDEYLNGDDEEDIDFDDWDTDLGTTFTITTSTGGGGDRVDIALGQLGDVIAFEGELLMNLVANTETLNIGSQTARLDFNLDSSDVDGDDTGEEDDGVRLEFSLDATDDEFDIDAPVALDGTSTTTFVNAGDADNEDGNSDVQTFVTKYGIHVVYDNEEKTYAEIKVPSEQVEGMAYLVFGGAVAEESSVTVDADAADDKVSELEDDGYTVVSRETVTAEEVEFDVTSAVVDSEVSGTSDMIVVGGPAVNSVAAELLGLAFPTSGPDSGVSSGEAVVRYFEDSNSVLVYGYAAADTKAAAERLNEGGLTGNTVNVQ